MVQLSLILLLFCALTVFLVLSSDNLTSAIHLYLGPLSRGWTIVLSSILILPICLVDQLHALRHASVVGLSCIFYVFLIIAVRFIHQSIESDLPAIKWVSLSENTLYTFSVQSLAYCCQFNVLPLFAELENPTRQRMNAIKTTTIVLCVVAFGAFGTLGYLCFGDATPGDVLQAFAKRNPYVALGRVALGVSLLLKCPLILHPLRMAVFVNHASFRGVRKLLSTLALLGPAVLVAIAVPNVEKIYSATGATAGALICFILPSIVFLGTNATKRRKIPAYCILALGIVSSIASFYVTLIPPEGLAASTPFPNNVS